MEGFRRALRADDARFPKLEADDLIQETPIALMSVLPNYRYQLEESGRFRNFLIGILRHKALKVCSQERRLEKVKGSIVNASSSEACGKTTHDRIVAAEEQAFKQAVADIALAEFFADPETAPRTKEVFRRVAMMGESPECVAQSFAISRHAVDQIKARTLARLRRRVAELEACDARGGVGESGRLLFRARVHGSVCGRYRFGRLPDYGLSGGWRHGGGLLVVPRIEHS